MIDLSDEGLAFGGLAIVQNGPDTLITDGNGNSITPDTMLVTDITAADFIF